MTTKVPAAPPAAQHYGWPVLVVLSVLMGFASISTDLYLPALPVMASALHSDAGQMELTISGYLVGFSLGQLVWGPVSDRFGRRGPIAVGLVLFIIGSAGCALSQSAGTIIAWRAVQAVGACAGVTLARAMVRDLYSGARAAQMLSTLMTVMAIAPLLGPIAGAKILALASWRAIFWVLVAIGAATLAALATLPETLPAARRNREPLLRAAARYGQLITEPGLLGYAGVGAFFYAGMFAYIAGAPFAYITYHHASPQLYALLFGLGIVGIMAANTVNARLVVRLGGERLLRLGASVALVAALVLAADAYSGFGGLAGLVAPVFVFIAMIGFIVANSISGAMANFPERAGAVSALVGAMQYGAGIAGSALLGLFADGTPWPLGWIVALSGAGAAACAWGLVPRPAPRTA